MIGSVMISREKVMYNIDHICCCSHTGCQLYTRAMHNDVIDIDIIISWRLPCPLTCIITADR